jgi:uncharacterized protein (DUF1800 family)
MKTSLPCCAATGFRLAIAALFLFVVGIVPVEAALKSPKLLSRPQDTRAIAFESITMKAEPFPVTSTVAYGSDNRTRLCFFATDIELLSGEGKNAFTSDIQDASGKIYPLLVEYVGQVPNFPGITMIIVRLNDEIGDVGDVLLRLNLHGNQSNRVRVAIGHSGGGPANDVGAVATPAPPTPPGADAPLTPDPYTGPAAHADAVRFLEQASWGPTQASLDHVKAVGFMTWLNEQFNTNPTNVAKGSNYPDLPFVAEDGTACPSSSVPGEQDICNRDNFSVYPLQRTFFSNSLYGPDQLRQRVAWALHQILVVSQSGEVSRPSWMTVYLQSLDRHAFGNYKNLLQEITLTPAMGEYLDMRLSTRTNPNENFAREILQLFSIGTDMLNLDGTPQRDSQGVPIPSYTQTTVNEFTRVFTGWNFVPGAIAPGTANWRDPMIPRGGSSNPHDFGAKTLLNGFTIAACSSSNSAQNIACAQADMTAAINNIFNHPNVGPFIGKQLIQHLVTSNPSGAYVERIAQVFNNDCSGLYPQGCTNTRGNLKLVVQNILLDPEARGDVKTDPGYGKLREPAQYINGFLRAFNVKSFDKLSTSDGVLGTRSSGADFTGTLDQPIFRPSTVFSYYQPGYEVPGTKLLGPAFGILSTSTTLRRANDINTLIHNGVSANTSPNAGSPDRPRGTSIDIANLEAMSVSPGDFQVTNYLNALLFHNTMSTQMRDTIVAAMNTINDSNLATRHQKRARMAVYLAATSSQYDIQR